MAWLEKADQSAFIKEIDSYLVRPLSDDVRTRMLALEGVEVTSEQFAKLHVLVPDCARILHLEKVPRVFLAERTPFPAVTENYSEPVVILQSGILDYFKEPAELRFLIGRELGHVKAGHTRWHTLVRRTKTFADRFSLLGDATTCAPLLPLLRWTRECETTADNAGLICAQNLKAAERVLIRVATGIDDKSAARINIDAFLRQSERAQMSDISEFLVLWRQWNKPAPFAPSRIRQLRQYHESARCRALWE